MTKPKLEPKSVRAWALIGEGNDIHLRKLRLDKEDAEVEAQMNEYDLIEVLITPVLPTHPPKLSGNTGELKQTKETPSDESENAVKVNIYEEHLCGDCGENKLTPWKREDKGYLCVACMINKYEEMVKNLRNDNGRLRDNQESLQSQLEDYRNALEWLHKQSTGLVYAENDDENNGIWEVRLYGTSRGRGTTPLSAIQNAMAKEESRNE